MRRPCTQPHISHICGVDQFLSGHSFRGAIISYSPQSWTVPGTQQTLRVCAHKMLMATPLSYTHCSHSQQVLDQSDHTKSYVVPWMLWSFSVVRIFFFFWNDACFCCGDSFQTPGLHTEILKLSLPCNSRILGQNLETCSMVRLLTELQRSLLCILCVYISLLLLTCLA